MNTINKSLFFSLCDLLQHPTEWKTEKPVIMLLVKTLITLLLPDYGQRTLEWPRSQARVGYDIRTPPNEILCLLPV